jgi:hypothetical protein
VTIGTVVMQSGMDVERLGLQIGQAARDRMTRVA